MVEAGLWLCVYLRGTGKYGGKALCFRPVTPRLEDESYLIWEKFQVVSKTSERFLTAAGLDD